MDHLFLLVAIGIILLIYYGCNMSNSMPHIEDGVDAHVQYYRSKSDKKYRKKLFLGRSYPFIVIPSGIFFFFIGDIFISLVLLISGFFFYFYFKNEVAPKFWTVH